MVGFLIASSAEAKVVYWPSFCDSGVLSVSNTTREEKSFWLQDFAPELVDETEYVLQPNQQVQIALVNSDSLHHHSLLHFHKTGELKTSYVCHDNLYPATEISGGIQIYEKSNAKHNKLWLQNLSHEENTLEISFLSRTQQVLKKIEISLSAYQQTTFDTAFSGNWAQIRIASPLKFISYLLHESGGRAADEVIPLAQPAPNNGIYFLAGARNSEDDSFVIKITDQELARKARNILATPSSEKIIFATIQRSPQSFNRNFSTDSRSHWAWSTKEVTGFGDFASTACNGHPQALEDRLDKWVNGIGRICFWNYRLLKELSPEEVSSGRLKKSVSQHPLRSH